MKAAFYSTKIDQLKMMVSANMDYHEEAPISNKQNCLELAIAVKPNTPKNEREEILHSFQFALIDTLVDNQSCLYAGRTSRPLQRNLYFYCDDDSLPNLAELASHKLEQHESPFLNLELRHLRDESWTVYSEILLPSESDAVEYEESDTVIL